MSFKLKSTIEIENQPIYLPPARDMVVSTEACSHGRNRGSGSKHDYLANSLDLRILHDFLIIGGWAYD